MFSARLPEPVLSIALEAVGNIQQHDEQAVQGLWSVLTKVRDAVVEGHRLENLAWRLWHRARIAPNSFSSNVFNTHMSSYPDTVPRPLSTPSLSFSSSSEGTSTSTSSDWDRETTVGDDDDVKHVSGARAPPAVSPLPEKSQLDLARKCASPAPSPTCRCHQHNSPQDICVCPRDSPRAPSQFAPHHPPRTDCVDTNDVYRLRALGNFPSDPQHHSPNLAPATAGLQVPSLSSPHNTIPPRTFSSKDRPHSSSLNFDYRTDFLIPNTSFPATEIVGTTAVSLSMPVTPTVRRDPLTVGRLVAQLFSENVMPKRRETTSLQFRSTTKEVQEHRSLVAPVIIEPQPSPAALLVTPSSPTLIPNSTATSATSTPRQSFPTVVIVNPTPHPTPPATPSPGVTATAFDLNSKTSPIMWADKKTDTGWTENCGPRNSQLATPVSLNSDARSAMVEQPTFIAPNSRSGPESFARAEASQSSHDADRMSLLPAASIALPEKPVDFTTSSAHLPTPAAESASCALQATDNKSSMMSSTRSTPAPIPTPVPVLSEDKKFFLAAPHSGSGGSGHDSSESPSSLSVGSVSPNKRDMAHSGTSVGVREVGPVRQEQIHREEEIASSFSACSPAGRAPSITSSRGGTSRFKARNGFTTGGGSKRRTSKKVMLLPSRDSKKDVQAKPAEGSQVREDRLVKDKGKEKETVASVKSDSSALPPQRVKSLQQLPLQRPHLQPLQSSHQLRQLPTNPPRQAPAAGGEIQPHVNPPVPPNTRHLPYHPQLGHLGLAHLPTVPPKQRRPIEITETSTEYETTDTDGEDSSWESQSCSGDDAAAVKTQAASSKGSRSAADDPAKTGKTTIANSNRTRDFGEFARDAAVEAQRHRDLFQKLPPRSYSNLAQLPRTKSGLSLLFRPDPELFPEGHPYRRTGSSHDILARNWSAPAPPLAITTLSKRTSAVEPVQAVVNADPVVSRVNSKTDVPSGSNGRRTSNPLRGGYRPRAKPDDQEEETDSGEEDPRDAIQVSSSVAQRRLAAIMGGARGTQSQAQSRRPSPNRTTSQHHEATLPMGPAVTRTTTMPVLMHPYLPDPAPIQTPHTIRRNIISQELDEELRRNLLWERSQNQIQGRPPRAPGSILPGPWRPLTGMRPAETDSQTNTTDKAPGKRSFATQRTKSWAGDYHASGW